MSSKGIKEILDKMMTGAPQSKRLRLPLHPRELYKLTPTDGLYREPCNVRCTVPEPCLFYGVMLRGEWRLHGIYLTTLGPPVPGGLTVSEKTSSRVVHRDDHFSVQHAAWTENDRAFTGRRTQARYLGSVPGFGADHVRVFHLLTGLTVRRIPCAI